ncbi:hypothetical protein THIOM_002022 [Candidatus Thiomargarita nelsonii]|uniref:Uncharacterized protein n=1 Tax=Candidatus Thiomargarita nelsonii TaxID=1003181 RepID=A0A176S275_9GAMM|nr:hypothetical protein THIOM_002022 [Candidatus Thiomargarita nelsonii]
MRVTGEVEEFYALTELKNVSKVTVCSRGASVTPATLNLPFDSHTYLEQSLQNMADQTTCKHELEKANLIIEQKDKEMVYLKEMIEQKDKEIAYLKEMIELMKKQA